MRKIFFFAAFLLTQLAVAQSPQLMIPMGHAGDISVLAVSPDRKWLASADDKGDVKLWDLKLAKEIKTFKYNSETNSFGIALSLDKITALNFNAESKKLFTATGSKLIITDLSDGGKEIYNKKIHENKITQILVSPNGKTFVTGADNEVRIWNENNLSSPKVVSVKGKQPKLAFDESNNIVVITTGNYIEVSNTLDFDDVLTNKGYITHINSSTGQVTSTEEFENLKDDHMYISPNGKLIALTRYEASKGIVQLLDASSGRALKKIVGIRDSSITLLSFSENSHYMATKAGKSIMLYDLATLQHLSTSYSDDIFSSAMVFGKDDVSLFQGINSNGSIVQWNVRERKVERVFNSKANFVKDLVIGPDQQSLILLAGVNEYRSEKLFLQKLDLNSAVLSVINAEGIRRNMYSSTIAAAGGAKLFEPSILNKVDLILSNKNISSFTISNNKKILVTTSRHGSQPKLYFYNIADGKEIKNISLQNSAYFLLFSKDDKVLYVGNYGNTIIKIEIETGTVTNTFEHSDAYSKDKKITAILLSNDETTLIGLNDSHNIYSWNVATGVELRNQLSPRGSSVKKIPNTQQIVYVDGSYNIVVYDLQTNRIIRSLKRSLTTDGALEVSSNGKFIFYSNDDKSISIFDLASGEEVATMVFFGQKDWVIVDKYGRFEGTNDGMNQMYYVKKLTIIPLESAFEKFFTPGLMASLLKGEKITPPPVNITTLKSPPVVKISYIEGGRNLVVEDDVATHNSTNSAAKIQVNAVCPTDAVTEIKLYQNGKLIQGTRNLVVADDVAAAPKMDKTFTVVLEAGQNIFKAIAFNTERTESTPVSLTVNYVPAKKDIPITSNITLHMLVVGINKYKNPKYNLNYAQADAEAFKKAMAAGGSSLFSSSQITYLSDAEATQSGINDAFQKIKTNAKPQDLFIFYYAGHGVINDKKEFFLVPYDVTQLYGNDAALAQKGFSAATLQEWSKEIKAQKQLFILDACQSAGALTSMAGARGAAEEKAIAQLARSTGTQWLTASGSEQFASEFGSLGHGSFTYCILQALSGSANTGSQLTVKQLDAYLQSKVPEITEKFKGTPQYPASYSYGNDFPIYIFK